MEYIILILYPEYSGSPSGQKAGLRLEDLNDYTFYVRSIIIK